MKTEAVKKIILTTFFGSDKNSSHSSISVNPLLYSNKHWNFSSKESETIWTPQCSSIHADLTPLHQANIKFSTTSNWPLIHLDITQADNLPQVLHKDSFIIPTFLMMVTCGTLTHQWSMMTKLTPKSLKNQHDLNII